MKTKDNSGWSDYVVNLKDFPSLTSIWEKEMVFEVKKVIHNENISRVLEAGCSNGRWLRWFCREYTGKGYGVDTNTNGFIKKDLNFQAGDAFNLPYRDNCFDIVLSLGLIEHFKKKDRLLVLKEQIRVLKKRGYIICEIPNLAFSLEYLWIKYAYELKQKQKHSRPQIITEKELIQQLHLLNIQVISSKFIGWFFERLKIPQIFGSRFTSNNILMIGLKK